MVIIFCRFLIFSSSECRFQIYSTFECRVRISRSGERRFLVYSSVKLESESSTQSNVSFEYPAQASVWSEYFVGV
jgi:hypothetical protein